MMMGKENRDRAGARIQINLGKRSCRCVWTGVSTLLSGAGKKKLIHLRPNLVGAVGLFTNCPSLGELTKMIKAKK